MKDLKNKEKELEKIKEETLKCKKCSLAETRNYPVIGEGNHRAKIMFIGEAPGAQEDKTGRPFCGTAGKILDKLLESVKLERKEIYICNILKCRPPNNRDPQEGEIESCVPYLEKQIELIAPEVICPLGRYSMQFLMEKFGLRDEIQLISKIHGKVFEINPSIKLIPLYHPAVVIYNPSMKEILEKDFKVLKKFK